MNNNQKKNNLQYKKKCLKLNKKIKKIAIYLKL